MVTISKLPVALETTPLNNPNPQQMNIDGHTQKPCSGYEQCRVDRIKENLERMQKLGIINLSLKLKSFKNTTTATPRNTPSFRKTPQRVTPLPPSGPTRRSSRLQNSTPVSYAEVQPSKKNDALKSDNQLLEEGSRPEIYTEEHEKQLGDTNMSWTLFVDGYGKDGKRIYDPVRGKTCHQCRQKTLGHRTHCSQCNMVQGQFCGDCLYMRYGENVFEANQNPEWICPVCRGICNCSLCRHAKGLAPTGILYKRISKLGFKSVAHYLIQTQRSDNGEEKNLGTKVPVSAKRSLPFSDEESPDSNDDAQGVEKPKSEENMANKNSKVTSVGAVDSVDHQGLLNPGSEDNKADDDFVINQKNEDVHCSDDKLCDRNVDFESNLGLTKESIVTTVTSDVHIGLLNSEDNGADGEFKAKKENNELCKSNVALNNAQGSKKKRSLATETTPDSIAGRLRQRRGKGCEHEKLELVDMNDLSCTSLQVDSIGGRLKQRRKCT